MHIIYVVVNTFWLLQALPVQDALLTLDSVQERIGGLATHNPVLPLVLVTVSTW